MQHAQGDKGEKRRRYGTVPIPGFVRHAWERAHNLSQTKNLEAYDRVYGGLQKQQLILVPAQSDGIYS